MTERLVRDIYHKGVIFCKPDTPLQEVVRVMADTDIHAVFVTTNDQVLGAVSHTDAIGHYGQDLTKIKAGEAMAIEVITIPENASVAEASKLMLDNAVDRLLVVDDEKGAPLGIISTTDVIRDMRGSKRVWYIG